MKGDGDGVEALQSESESGCETWRDEANSPCACPGQRERRNPYEADGGIHHGHGGKAVASGSESVQDGMSMQSHRVHHRGPCHEVGPCCGRVRDVPSRECGQDLLPVRVRCRGAYEPPRLPSPVLSTSAIVSGIREQQTG